MITGLYSDSITLHLIDDDNVAGVSAMFQGFSDSEEMIREMKEKTTFLNTSMAKGQSLDFIRF